MLKRGYVTLWDVIISSFLPITPSDLKIRFTTLNFFALLIFFFYSANSKSICYVICLWTIEHPHLTAIGKTGVPHVPSVWLCYSAADTFLDDRTHAVRQRTCQECAFAWYAFWRRTFFRVIDPHSLAKEPKGGGKISFVKKWPLNGKISKFRCQRIHRHMDSHISAKLRGNR